MKQIEVVIVMGSESDLPTMKGAVTTLRKFGVNFKIDVVSAHRTPQLLQKSVDMWEEGGIKVIIAGAGGAAHLPGMLASYSILPVIGVPVKSKALEGLDALLSVVQMPKGVPVATVGIGNSENAGLLAIKILSLYNKSQSSQKLKSHLSKYKKELAIKVAKMRKSVSKRKRI
jgi:5-(carboxyamino)imidazole ribonucleotide mutase